MATFEDLRKRAGLTREELAVKCQVSAGTVQNWERGRSLPSGTMGTLLMYCNALGCTPEELVQAGKDSGYLR